MSHVRTQAVGDNHLIVKPTVSLSPPVGLTRSPAILSRQEILRRREENEAARRIVIAAPHVPGAVEMHQADMTPIPKNKGGRPKKKD